MQTWKKIMSKILLAKPNLPPGFIDVSVGEPHVVRETLLNTFDLDLARHPLPAVKQMHEYPLPTGYQPLVEMLEDYHGAPVIITNGAKQALGACFYALKRMGKSSIGMRTPYWALIPPLAKMHDMVCVDEYDYTWDSYLSLSPNNPDGHLDNLKERAKYCQLMDVPLIHDAAYYSHVYMHPTIDLPQFGDVQIYSVSKMFGLSGLRLGYAVCSNPEFYRYIQEYMETMTVGVSVIPQIFLEQLLKKMQRKPDLTQEFELLARNSLTNAKEIMEEVDPEVLEIPNNLSEIPGMFGWFKVGPKCNFTQARINAIDGSLFGVPGYVRINLAFSTRRMREIVDRLNSAKEGR
jgi:aspartate/methionine/tyrosine aminotransferase